MKKSFAEELDDAKYESGHLAKENDRLKPPPIPQGGMKISFTLSPNFWEILSTLYPGLSPGQAAKHMIIEYLISIRINSLAEALRAAKEAK